MMMIPVFVDGKWVREVTHRQTANEIAGKVLKQRTETFTDNSGDRWGWARRAERRSDGAWHASHIAVRIA